MFVSLLCHLYKQFISFRLIQNKRIEYEKIGVQITTNLGETKHVLFFFVFIFHSLHTISVVVFIFV